MSQAPSYRSGLMLIAGAAVLWGTTGTAQSFAPAGASPLSVGAVRLAVGGLALFCFALCRGLAGQFAQLPRGATLLSAACVAGYQLFFFAAVKQTGVAVGTVVAIGSAPVFAGLLSAAILGQRPHRGWFGATFLAISGCAVLAWARGNEARADIWGILLALGAGASYALYTVASVRMLARASSVASAAATFFLGAVLLSPLLFSQDLSWVVQGHGPWVALELGLGATALSYLLYTRGLTVVPVATAVTLALGEPLAATLLAVTVVGETLSSLAWTGLALVFAGLAWIARSRDSTALS